MALDVKAELRSYQKRPSLTQNDRAHLSRWLVVANDPVWQKILMEIQAQDELPPFVDGGPFLFVVASALRARRYAEAARYETVEMKKQKERKAQERREGLLSFASAIEEVVQRLRTYRRTEEPPHSYPNSPGELDTALDDGFPLPREGATGDPRCR